MLKVKNEKGKFDIVLNEAKLFDAEARDKRRQNSKGFSSKTSQAWPSQPKTSKKQVSAVNQLKKTEKTKTVQMGHQRDINDDVLTRKKPSITRKELPSNDASYLTKDQLSRIMSSLSNHDQPAGLQGSMKSESQKTLVHQSLAVNTCSQTSTDLAHASDFKTSAGDAASPEQATLLDKNFQWKKELDEQIALKQKLKAEQNLLSKEDKFEEYNPWGRPGAGAPIRTQSGNVVADYKKMVQNEAHVDAMPLQTSDERLRMKTTGQASNTHYFGTEVPAAMRSSFAVGAPGIVTYETNQSKAEGKKKWLQDLEQQIKEKKEREAQEKLQQTLKESKHETWYQTPVPRVGSSASATVPASSASTKQHFPLQTVEASVAPAAVSDRPGNVHARGHGLQSLGQLNQDELEKKRIKTLEHQLAIKEQVEEKRRIKQEEKERRMKEEAEKERALAQERARLQNQYQEELKMRHEKEEEARRRAEALQNSVSQAHQLAQQEKAAKRIKHLESGGHDVSGLRSRMETDHNSVHQDTAVGQPSTDSLSYVTEYPQSSPRIGHAGSELPKGDNIASSYQNNALLESELKEISLNASLESQWTPSSPVSSRRNDSQAKSQSDSSPVPRKAATRQSNKTTRAQSERSQRKTQPLKHQIKKRTSLENVTQGEIPPPLEDAFMLPYRRTASATFPANMDTPAVSSHQDTNTNTNKPTVKKPDQTAPRKTTNTKNYRKNIEGVKVSEITRTGKGISAKTSSTSKMAEKRKVKPDKANIADRKPLLHPEQVSPDSLPTARQEMILQQLAALRQGLMMKERELHHGAL